MVRLFALLFLILAAHSRAGDSTVRILLVGDSWPGIMWAERSLKQALDAAGLGMYEERGDLTAIGGSTAAGWTSPARLQLLTDELSGNPTIDIVHLSIGGNDVLAGADNATILNNIEIVVDHILSRRSDIRVLLVGYDFLPTIVVPGLTPETQNGAQIDRALTKLALAQNKPRFYFKLNLGLMHAKFGVGIFAPGVLPLPGGPPNYEPFPGGDPTLLSDPSTFRDAIHLSPEGYVALAEHCIAQFYADWLANPFVESSTRMQWTLYD